MAGETLEETLARIAGLAIEMVPADMERYFLFSRDGFACLVERVQNKQAGTPPAFGSIGSVCRMTDQGIAAVVYSGDGGYYAGKGFRLEASPEELALARQFSSDLRKAIRGGVF